MLKLVHIYIIIYIFFKIRGRNGSPSPIVAPSLLKSKDVSLVSYGHLIDEAKCLGENFTFVFFSHVRKQGNFTGHNLARHVSGVLSVDERCSVESQYYNLSQYS